LKYLGTSNEFLRLEELGPEAADLLVSAEVTSALTLVWFLDDHTSLEVDGSTIAFEKDQVVFITEFHRIRVLQMGKVRLLRFNRAFYCILDHDHEVGCKGILFFGSRQLPSLCLSPQEQRKLQMLFEVIKDELSSSDGLQLSMLQLLLKRLLILCTRIYKDQQDFKPVSKSELDLVREYNFLVEKHFREHHQVSAYAEMLHKSPKTLSNLFSDTDSPSPLQVIHNRIMLEARRLLRYTDKTVQEIAYDLGFEDLQTFSRFFKRNEGISPSGYKS
jgi:AraC-like DNA-binding protein